MGEPSDETVEDLNCGFCLQKLMYMIEPKQLPCTHVFCLPCLQEDPKKDCPICGLVYDADWTKLQNFEPVYSNGALDAEIKANGNDEVPVNCDLCDQQKAVCYCVECEQKLCDDHFKIHQRFAASFATKHYQIDMAVYQSDVKKYKPQYCPSHENQKLALACYNCHELFCESCKSEMSRCGSHQVQFVGAKVHELGTIAMVADRMKQELDAKMKAIADKRTAGLNVEKRAWAGLHEVEEEVSTMMAEVDKDVQKAIVTLNECGQEIKKQLREHQKRCTAIIEEYSLGLREKGDRLEDMWSSINRKRKRKHATEVIRSFSTVGEEIDSFQAVRFKQAPRLPRITYLHKGSTDTLKDSYLSAHIIKQPDPMNSTFTYKEHIATKDTGGSCYSVAWNGHQLYIAAHTKLITHNTVTGEETNRAIPKENVFNCVRALDSGELAVLTALCGKVKGVRNIRISPIESLFNRSSLVFSFTQDNNYLTHIAVSDSHIAVSNYGKSNLILYSADGDEMYAIGAGQLKRPWGVFLIGEEFVLVTETTNGRLHKYRLEADAKPVWVCENLQSPTGICVDAEGNIFVASGGGACIYVVSPEGKMIRTLTCPELKGTKSVHDISLSHDGKILALACRDEGVKLFTLTVS